MTEPTTDPRIERAERLAAFYSNVRKGTVADNIKAVCDDLIALARENATLSAAVQQGCAREAELVTRVEELERESVRLKEKAEALEYGNGYQGEFLAEAIRRAEAAERENARLRERVETLSRLDREAATHVEAVICMRTHFTGDGEYVGWRGLGKALSEALDERDRLRELAEGMAIAWETHGDPHIGMKAWSAYRAEFPKPTEKNNA